ncbi:uncharacterized protein LOC112551083 [Alligator sinensis]|uniref:Uncharacterized protein LOC112551083 n=1 Tax=Alligator sinensis TaxID=38654 RepID=A0A3Q0H1C7_ALLSI|nr:uncharacterized protein LOC112551083 [Alligator sinensis]XP_025065812.1 uncharacterized protein LOC112551083 [Alligator sinensis]
MGTSFLCRARHQAEERTAEAPKLIWKDGRQSPLGLGHLSQKWIHWYKLGNRYEALAALEESAVEETAWEEPQSIPEQAEGQTSYWRKRRRVIVVGDSLLRGAEGNICRPDPMAREVCCLPEAKIQDVIIRIPDLIQPLDYYPMVLIHVGTNDTARSNPDHVVGDYRALGARLREMGAQVVFLSILPVRGHSRHHNTCIREVNLRLRSWCHCAGSGFLDHDPHFLAGDFLGHNGFHLSAKGCLCTVKICKAGAETERRHAVVWSSTPPHFFGPRCGSSNQGL